MTAEPALLTTRLTSGSWGWFGAEVTAAVDLRFARHHTALAPDRRAQRALEEERAWLARLLGPGGPGAVELRWVADGDGGLRVFVLGRLATADEDLAPAVEVAVGALADLPSHVVGEVVEDPDVLARALLPFPPVLGGAAAIRRRCVTAAPRRPDAGVSYYFAVQPLHVDPHGWPAVVAALAGTSVPTVLSVGIEPAAADPALVALLDQLAGHYAPLAQSGRTQATGLYVAPEDLEPDPFAVAAEALYREAAAQLRGGGFRFGIRVAAAAGELSPSVTDALADLLRAPAGRHGAATELEGVTADLDPVADPEALAAFERNLSSLAFEPWGGSPVWQWPTPPPARLAALTELADFAEVSAVARLPVATEGVLDGFPVETPQGAARDPAFANDRRARHDLFISYAREDGRPAAEALVSILHELAPDISAFVDLEAIAPGSSWQQEIFDCLDSCRLVVPLLTPGFVASRVCQEELNIALVRNRVSDESVLVPLYVLSTDLPAHLQVLDHVDCREADPDRLRTAAVEILARLER